MARRRYQSGSLKLIGTVRKKWVLRWREDVVTASGSIERLERKTTIGFLDDIPTKRLARRKADLILAPINRVDRRLGRPAIMGDFAGRWMEMALPSLKPSSAASARLHLSGHIVPAFGSMSLDEIDIEAVQRFVSQLDRKRKTIANILTTLRAVLRDAKTWGYDAAEWKLGDVRLPQRSPTRKILLDEEQVSRVLLRAAMPWRALIALVAMTGLRIGEALALTVEDLDFDNGWILVRQSVTRRKITLPKTEASAETVPLPEPLAAILREHIEARRVSSGLVFASQLGGPLESQKCARKYLWPLLEAEGFPRVSWHAFRHGMASLLLRDGASAAVAQRQLRHADPRVTLGIYSHVVGQEHRAAAERVAARMWPVVASHPDKPLQVQ